jgi:hypothetical protein
MAVFDSCSLPSFINDADGTTSCPFEDTTLMSLGKANTIHEKYQPKNCSILADVEARYQTKFY